MLKSLLSKLKEHLNQNERINHLILFFLLGQVLFFRWLNISVEIGYIVDLLIVTNILINYQHIRKETLFLFITICIYFLTSYVICGGTLRNTIGNLRDIFPTMLTIIFFIYLIDNKKDYLFNTLKKLFIPLNIYMILNIIAAYFQSKGVYWLSGIFAFPSEFKYNWDAISGLFGTYGVPLFGLYKVLLLIYNIVYLRFIPEKKKGIYYIYNLLLFIYGFYISMINDDKIFYLFIAIFPLLLLFSHLMDSNTLNIKFILKKYGFLFAVPILVVGADMFTTKIINRAMTKMIRLLRISALYYNLPAVMIDGSGERIAIIVYFFKKLNIFVGKGLGYGRWTQPWLFGYKHFGINNLCSILCLGGFVLFVLISKLVYDYFKVITNKTLLKVMYMLSFFFMIFVTQPITDFSSLIMYLFIFIIIDWDNSLNNLEE